MTCPKQAKTSIEQVFKALLMFIPSPHFNNTYETTYLRTFCFLLIFFPSPSQVLCTHQGASPTHIAAWVVENYRMGPGRAMTKMTTNDQEKFVWTSSSKKQASKIMPWTSSSRVEQALSVHTGEVRG